MNQILVAGMYY